MAKPKRSKLQREEDLRDVARLYLQGKSHLEIAAFLKEKYQAKNLDYSITREQVTYDIEELRKEWKEARLLDVDARIAQELAKIDKLESTYWDAWERSLQPKLQKSVEREAPDFTELDSEELEKEASEFLPDPRQRAERGRQMPLKKVKVSREQRDGNPQFLAGVQWCIERRCKLLGLDAPEKSELTIGDAIKVYEGVDVDRVLSAPSEEKVM